MKTLKQSETNKAYNIASRFKISSTIDNEYIQWDSCWEVRE